MPKCNRCGKSGPFLKLNTEGLCKECQLAQFADMKAALSPEQLEYVSIQEATQKLEQYHGALQSEVTTLRQEIDQKKGLLVQMDEEILLQDYALYKPRYSFCSSDEYKNRLYIIRQQQKDMIKSGAALILSARHGWSYSNNLQVSGPNPKMIQDISKLILRAFNCECEEIVDKVKYHNFEASLKRMSASRDAISKLGVSLGISISPSYYASKVDELTLALEYQQKKQQEQERQKEIREQMREEARLQRELEEARRVSEKEQSHYLNALSRLETQILHAEESEKDILELRKKEIQEKLDAVTKALKEIDYREANQRAGYVYIISNVGSFGENVYKIGMTRRLNPTERIDELGDASVPFDFDVHAMIFSDDAPALEAALHKAFEDRKVNLVNPRREFFYVTLAEIKEEIRKHYDKTAEFIEFADAEQYRISKKIREQME